MYQFVNNFDENNLLESFRLRQDDTMTFKIEMYKNALGIQVKMFVKTKIKDSDQDSDKICSCKPVIQKYDGMISLEPLWRIQI